MRRILVFLISFVTLFIGIESVDAFSSKLTLNKNNIGPNAEVEVTLSVSELSATGLATATYYIDFDTSKLTYEGIVRYGQSKPSGDFTIADNGSGTLTLVYLDGQGGPNKLSNGDIIVLKFKTKATVTSGSSSFGLSGKGFADSNVATLTSTNTGITLTYKVASTDANLMALSVTGATISPSFSAAQLNYTATVENSVKSINISALVNNEKATLTGTGAFDLKVGKNTFNIIVTAENQTKKTYTVTIVREDAEGNAVALSDNNYLKSLTIAGHNIAFSKHKETYEVRIQGELTLLDIHYELEDKLARAEMTGNIENSNKVEVVVTSESGLRRTYTIRIIRAEQNDIVKPAPTVPEPEEKEENTFLYIGLGVGGLLVVLLGLYLIGKSQKKSENIEI